jgi:hypothetical protein
MQFSGAYVIVTQPSESAYCRLNLHIFQAGKLNVTYTSRATLATQCRSISTLGSVYDVVQANLYRCEPNFPAWCTNVKLPAAETDYCSGILVELTPCGHRSEKNSISTAKE